MFMIRGMLAILIAVVPMHVASAPDHPDKYYKPKTTSNLRLNYGALGDDKKRRSNTSSVLDQGCPDAIVIGGVGEDSRVFGDVEIEVNIDEGVVIDCSGI